uniref:Uncharacterized protein n=1 Tax=Opuntia streptacantha TaxID=393608 RepID=A0A7C8Z3F5_OPUST
MYIHNFACFQTDSTKCDHQSAPFALSFCHMSTLLENRKNNVLLYQSDRTSNGLLKGIDFTIEPEIGAANQASIWTFIMLLMSLGWDHYSRFRSGCSSCF